MSHIGLRKAVFLDRDGTLIVDKNYLSRIEDVELISGTAEAIRLLNEHHYLTIVVSNQSGVARGYFDQRTVDEVHLHINNLLKQSGAMIDRFFYCPHHPTEGIGDLRQDCDCRKPRVGMFRQAAAEFPIDLPSSWMIGDKPADVEFGHNTGLKPILVATGYGASSAGAVSDYVYKQNILEAVQHILAAKQRP